MLFTFVSHASSDSAERKTERFHRCAPAARLETFFTAVVWPMVAHHRDRDIKERMP
jgi:hypothetical protein